MANVVRSIMECTCRTAPRVRSGTFDDGRTWSLREVEIVDGDQNKQTIRIAEGLEMESGKTYSATIDSSTSGASKVTIVAVAPVPAGVK